MNKQIEKIKKFSEVGYYLSVTAFVIFIVIGALQALTVAWFLFDLPDVGIWQINIPGVANIEDLFGTLDAIVIRDAVIAFLQTVTIVVALSFTKSIFKILQSTGSPFSGEIAEGLKKLSITLLIVGCLSGLIGLTAAAIFWLLYLIFKYGCELQNESDTTL